MSVSAIIYIGSSSVSGGLLDGKKLIFTAERECHFQEKLDSTIFADTVAEALKLLMNDLLTARAGTPALPAGNPSKVTVFLSSPFVAGQLNVLRQSAPKPFRITEKVIWNLIEREEAKLKIDRRHILVDSKTMRFALNGYVVSTPHGQRVSDLELAHYLSIGDNEILTKFRNIIKGACHHEAIAFHSASFAIFSVVRHLRPADESLLLIDVGGEITELALVWQGIIQKTLSFPLGAHALIREVIATRGLTPAVARSHLELGQEKKTDAVGAEWLDSFMTGISQILQHRFWGGEIILITEDAALGPRFSELLARAPLGKITFSARPVATNTLSREALAPFVGLAPAAKPSLPLFAAAAFVLI